MWSYPSRFMLLNSSTPKTSTIGRLRLSRPECVRVQALWNEGWGTRRSSQFDDPSCGCVASDPSPPLTRIWCSSTDVEPSLHAVLLLQHSKVSGSLLQISEGHDCRQESLGIKDLQLSRAYMCIILMNIYKVKGYDSMQRLEGPEMTAFARASPSAGYRGCCACYGPVLGYCDCDTDHRL